MWRCIVGVVVVLGCCGSVLGQYSDNELLTYIWNELAGTIGPAVSTSAGYLWEIHEDIEPMAADVHSGLLNPGDHVAYLGIIRTQLETSDAVLDAIDTAVDLSNTKLTSISTYMGTTVEELQAMHVHVGAVGTTDTVLWELDQSRSKLGSTATPGTALYLLEKIRDALWCDQEEWLYALIQIEQYLAQGLSDVNSELDVHTTKLTSIDTRIAATNTLLTSLYTYTGHIIERMDAYQSIPDGEGRKGVAQLVYELTELLVGGETEDASAPTRPGSPDVPIADAEAPTSRPAVVRALGGVVENAEARASELGWDPEGGYTWDGGAHRDEPGEAPAWSVDIPVGQFGSYFGWAGEDMEVSVNWTWYAANWRTPVRLVVMGLFSVWMGLWVLGQLKKE